MKAFLLGRFLTGLLWLAPFHAICADETRGVIDDPDGYVNVRASQGTDSAIVAKVKEGEPFTFERVEGSDWAKVKLPSGKSGWMHSSRIRLYFTEADLSRKPKGKDNTEIGQFGQSNNVDYYAITRRAAQGDSAGLKQFLSLAESVDGGAAETYYSDLGIVVHLLGDAKFAAFLRSQPLSAQILARRAMADAEVAGIEPDYFNLRFPKTSAIFHRAEITDWPSPNGQFVIRKTFANAEDIPSSKVARAELIEKSSGKVILDLTKDDIGTGADREGTALWSPDSKRFAYMSANLQAEPRGNKFIETKDSHAIKQTTFYRKNGERFEKVPVALNEPPDRKQDRELKGATLEHAYTEPVRWTEADTVLLERHDYLQTNTGPGGSLEGHGRLYDITVNIPAEGDAVVKWKLNDKR